MNIARSSTKIFAANTIGSVIGFLGIAFFARELGPHQLGIFFLFQAVLGMLSIPTDLGISQGLAKRISEGERPGEILSTAFLIKLLPLSIISAIILLFEMEINEYLGSKLSLFLICALAIQELSKLAINLLQGELRVGATALPNLAKQITYVGLGAFLILIGFNAEALVYSLIIGQIAAFGLASHRSSIDISRPSIEYAHSLLDYSRFAFISSIGGYVYNWVDVAIIGLFLAQSQVGAYEVAWRVTAVTMLFSRAIATSIFPKVSKLNAQDNQSRIEEVLTESMGPTLFFVIPAFFGVLLLSGDILGVLFGDQYRFAWLVLIVLMSEKVLQSIHVLIGRALQGINRADLAAKAAVISMLVNLSLNVILVQQFGILGAAIATVISFSINTLLHVRYLSRFITIRIPLNVVGGSITASVGMYAALSIIHSRFAISNIYQLIATIFAGIFVYSVLVLVFPPTRALIWKNYNRLVT